MELNKISDRVAIHYILEIVHEFMLAQEWYGPNADNLYENVPLIEEIHSKVGEILERPII